jgi:5-formyltetrahydrofolate cyclo-ligase
MKKNELRNIYKAKRLDLSVADRNRYDDLMLIQFQSSEIDIPSIVMSYMPIQTLNEFDTQLITDYCYFKNPGQILLFPVVNETDGSMEGRAVTDDTAYQKNRLGVLEPVSGETIFPEEIDLVLVPLLAFDRRGFRVGYGKGYYDRFLLDCRDDVVKVGFSYFEPVERIVDMDKHDIKLDYCITPHEIYRF